MSSCLCDGGEEGGWYYVIGLDSTIVQKRDDEENYNVLALMVALMHLSQAQVLGSLSLSLSVYVCVCMHSCGSF